MRNLTLNIGLQTSKKFNEGVTPNSNILLEELLGLGFIVKIFTVRKSNTEQTFVAKINTNNIHALDVTNKLQGLSSKFMQDCIAVRDDDASIGILVGDYAVDWGGKFNPEYFLDITD